MPPIIPDTTALDTSITSAITASSSSHNSTTDIQAIQAQAALVEADLAWNNRAVQTVGTTGTGTRYNATFRSGTPWPSLSS